MADDLRTLETLTPEELHVRTRWTHQQMIYSEWELGKCLLAIERTKMHLLYDCKYTVRYAAKYLGMRKQKAAEVLRAARRLEELPQVKDAYRTGQLTWTKVRELTRWLQPATEEAGMQYARTHSAEQIRKRGQVAPPLRFGKPVPREVSVPGGWPALAVEPATKPVPKTARYRVTLTVDAAQLELWMQAEARVRSLHGEKLSREECAVEMARLVLAGVEGERQMGEGEEVVAPTVLEKAEELAGQTRRSCRKARKSSRGKRFRDRGRCDQCCSDGYAEARRKSRIQIWASG